MTTATGGRIRCEIIQKAMSRVDRARRKLRPRATGLVPEAPAAVGRRFPRALFIRDIAFWMISQRILPPVAVVIPIYVLFQHVGLLDTRTALVVTYAAT